MKFKYSVFFILLFEISQEQAAINDDALTMLANRIGRSLWDLGNNLTRPYEVKSDYAQMNVTEIDHDYIIEEMANRIHKLLERKKSSLHRIIHTVEESTKTLADTPDEKMRSSYSFMDSKNLSLEDRIKLVRNVNFFNNPVNINVSTVHVPTDVYSRSNETLLGIYASEVLDPVFHHNYETDPLLSWQYFAGASGFMRIYPGLEWVTPEDQADLFDARTRPWYVEAATDPKDIVILVDNSGSMMGQKKKIARHTVNTILETLGPNDFVNIFQFEDETLPVTECFKNSLVQANLVTIRELKFGVENMSKANNLANFPEALDRAFDVLHHHREEHLASMCNQAIMLITDGVPDSYISIFQRQNWKNSTEPPFPIRVFTYLIGRDGTDFRETKWMACANQGYYVQLNTIPEVKEQVFNYINVLARPMVLKDSKKIAWTSLYAHRIDPKITDFRWEKQQNDQQKEYTVKFRDNWRTFLNMTAQRKRAESWRKIMLDQNRYTYEEEEFHFMISISHPAYDQRKTRNITENVLINEAYWTQKVYEANVATLLGVAGTDVPISEFKKIMKPHYLGVNNYGFIVNNNGYIIVHPDHRPFFRGTLKPGYNSVDMLEVELLDKVDADETKDPRDFDIQVLVNNNGEPSYVLSNLSLLRDLVINQTDSSNQSYQVKYHYDNMKRVSTGRRNYHIKKIPESPFTLVLATMRPPCNGSNCQPARVVAPNIEKKVLLGTNPVRELFSGNWNVHPEWFYCKYNYQNEQYSNYADGGIINKTTEILHFMKKIATAHDAFWDELKDPYGDLPKEKKQTTPDKKYSPYGFKKEDKNLEYYCDQELVRSLIFDANLTKNMFRYVDTRFKTPAELNFSKDSIQAVFISTHSGLTRWKDFSNDTSFGFIHSRAIDEVYYKRAVQQYYINRDSFVFSVPLEKEYSNTTVVTASHAIFVKERRKRTDDALQAPVAVVGFQLLYSDFDKYIRNLVDGTRGNSVKPILYYVIDNNGYIMAANDTSQVGKFFGTIDPDLMEAFLECRVFKKTIIYDYQGVCFYEPNASNAAFTSLASPFTQISHLVSWTIGTFLLGILRINLEILTFGLILPFKGTLIVSDDDSVVNIEVENFDAEIEEPEPSYKPKYSKVKHVVVLNRTRPQTCDRGINLYNLEPEKMWERRADCANMSSIFRPIPHTNLILVMVPQPEASPLVETSENVTVVQNKSMNTDPFRIKTQYNYNSPVCYKVNAVLSRRRPSNCCKDDKDEKKITLCGGGSSLIVTPLSSILTLLICSRFFLPNFVYFL